MQRATMRWRREAWWLRRAPAIVLVFTGTALGLCWLIVLAVDVLDVAGVRQALFVGRGSNYPYAFYHLFADNHPVEWLQWMLLILAIVAVAMAAGMLRASRRGSAWGVGLLAVALGFVALQDSGNQRHVAADLAAGIGGEAAATAVAFASLAAVGLLALGGLAAAWPALRKRAGALPLVLGGYAAYGVVGLMDARSELWYDRAGALLLDRVVGGRLLDPPAAWEPRLLEWLVMDAFVEESIELVAAGLLAAGALLLVRTVVSELGEPAEPARARVRV